jgi:hypothetical protein
MNDDELITAVKESLTDVHMNIPAKQIVSRSRTIRARRRIPVLTGALGVAAATVIAVTTLLPGSHHPSPQPSARLAAWTVTTQAHGIIHVTVRELRDPAGLQAKLRADGVPASVSFGNGQQTPCRPYPGGGFRTSGNPALINSVFPPHLGPPPAVNIRPSALPSGTGVLLAFNQGSQHGAPGIGIAVGVVQASQQCTGS